MRRLAKVILVNGSFGVGKTTVARALRDVLPSSTIYDPEYVGSVLRRLPQWVPLSGASTDDFQDMPAWRRSAILGTRITCRLSSGPVIVPMTFDRPSYFDEVWGRICTLEPTARAFCLTATLPTIRKRLQSRGTDPDGLWISRRVKECLSAHVDDRFGCRIDTENRGVDEVVSDIVERITLRRRSRYGDQNRNSRSRS
jgi:broad-specificity NMP kinase